METEPFDLVKVHSYFCECLLDDEDVLLARYLDAFEQINKMFTSMGYVFGFVQNDVVAKIAHLRRLVVTKELVQQDGVSYENIDSVKSVVIYERDNGLFNKRGYISGARNIVRLHRGLDFLRQFLRSILQLKDTDSVVNVCKESYHETLGKHHTWLIRVGANTAMNALPTRQKFFLKICDENDEKAHDLIKNLPDALTTIDDVINRMQNICDEYQIHQLS